MSYSAEQIKKAGQILKVIHLANSPGMDEVAIKLNMGLTYDEEQAAKRWAAAFELATSDKSIFEAAQQLAEQRL